MRGSSSTTRIVLGGMVVALASAAWVGFRPRYVAVVGRDRRPLRWSGRSRGDISGHRAVAPGKVAIPEPDKQPEGGQLHERVEICDQSLYVVPNTLHGVATSPKTIAILLAIL